MQMKLSTHSATALFAILATAVFSSSRCQAQAFSPYSEFQAMSLAELATLRCKLTCVGSQSASIATTLFGASGTILDVELFRPFRRTGQTYASDDFSPHSFTASALQLKALIDSVGVVPEVTDGDVDAGGTVSFSLLNTAGDTTRVFEAIVNKASGQKLFGQMLPALSGIPLAVQTMSAFGCAVGMLPSNTPLDVQAQVQVKASGLRADRQVPGQFVGKVRITNTSGATIPAPLVLIVIIPADADLVGADGATCNSQPSGHPLVRLLASGGLAPGAALERTLRFAHAAGTKLNVEFRVLSGPGTP